MSDRCLACGSSELDGLEAIVSTRFEDVQEWPPVLWCSNCGTIMERGESEVHTPLLAGKYAALLLLLKELVAAGYECATEGGGESRVLCHYCGAILDSDGIPFEDHERDCSYQKAVKALEAEGIEVYLD